MSDFLSTKCGSSLRRVVVLAVVVMISAGSVYSQESDDKLKFLDDALQALEKAKRRQLLDDSSQKVDEKDAIFKSLREKAAAAAKNRGSLSDLDEDSLVSRAKADALIKRASPEARRLIARGSSVLGDGGDDQDTSSDTATAVRRLPGGREPQNRSASVANAPAASPVEIEMVGGVPVPLPDTGADVRLNRKTQSDNEKMRITCRGTSFYDKSGNVILFEDQVVAKHPGFLIQCEEMEVFLEAGAIAPGSSSVAKKSTAGQDSAGIRRAVAKGQGKQVDLVRYTPKGELTGKCGLVKFDGRTGDIELRDWPTVSNGKFTRRAATKDAVIIIRQNGEHKTTGKFLDDFGKTDDNS